MPEISIDIRQLREDILAAAQQYDGLACAVLIAAGGQTERLSLGGMSTEDDALFLLDGAGGMMAGLSALKLWEMDRLSPETPVFRYIPSKEMRLAPELNVERLLRRSSGLPDPMRSRLLPELYTDAEHTTLDEAERLTRETAALLSQRDYASMTKLAGSAADCTAVFAPSSLDETLLCRITERISGVSIADFQQEHIFSPLDIMPQRGSHTPAPGHIGGAGDILPEFFVPEEAKGVYTVTLAGLECLLEAAVGDGLLSEEGWREAERLAGSCSLPFSRREGLLAGSSDCAGWTVTLLVERSAGVGVLVASDRPLPVRGDGGVYRRPDIEFAACINARRIYPAHTRMERLCARNVQGVMAIETDIHENDYVPSPVSALAVSAADRSRETFAASERGVTVGMVSLSTDLLTGRGVLETVLTDRRYRRRGFGRIMVKWALGYLRSKNMGDVVLCVDRRNIPAQELYSSLGFELRAVYEKVFVLGMRL